MGQRPIGALNLVSKSGQLSAPSRRRTQPRLPRACGLGRGAEFPREFHNLDFSQEVEIEPVPRAHALVQLRLESFLMNEAMVP